MEGEPNVEKLNKLAKLNSMRTSAYDIDGLSTHKKVFEFAKSLEAKYPNYKDYELYHLLLGNTQPASSPNFDFPGDDSVEKFIRSL